MSKDIGTITFTVGQSYNCPICSRVHPPGPCENFTTNRMWRISTKGLDVHSLMARGDNPFPSNYDPCPTCSYKSQNEILKAQIEREEQAYSLLAAAFAKLTGLTALSVEADFRAQVRN